jgi:hypothetical protein
MIVDNNAVLLSFIIHKIVIFVKRGEFSREVVTKFRAHKAHKRGLRIILSSPFFGAL